MINFEPLKVRYFESDKTNNLKDVDSNFGCITIRTRQNVYLCLNFVFSWSSHLIKKHSDLYFKKIPLKFGARLIIIFENVKQNLKIQRILCYLKTALYFSN